MSVVCMQIFHKLRKGGTAGGFLGFFWEGLVRVFILVILHLYIEWCKAQNSSGQAFLKDRSTYHALFLQVDIMLPLRGQIGLSHPVLFCTCIDQESFTVLKALQVCELEKHTQGKTIRWHWLWWCNTHFWDAQAFKKAWIMFLLTNFDKYFFLLLSKERALLYSEAFWFWSDFSEDYLIEIHVELITF